MNEKVIWDFLSPKIKNDYGVAGLMGNLFAESSLNPINATGNKGGLTNEQYTAVVDENKNDNFATDGVAYGLVQWRYHTRKKGLLDLARSKKTSVGNIQTQLEYMWQELQSYKTVLNTLYSAKSIREASDVVMLKYEKPGRLQAVAVASAFLIAILSAHTMKHQTQHSILMFHGVAHGCLRQKDRFMSVVVPTAHIRSAVR